MGIANLTAYRGYQDLGTIGQNVQQLAGNMQSVNQILDVGCCNTADILHSFVRVEWLTAVGLAKLINGNQLQLGITAADSIQITGDPVISLVGDVASPGATMYYGTDSGGLRGWYAYSAGGGTVTSITSSTLTVAGTSAVPTIDLSSGQVTNIGKGGTALQPGNVADSITTSGGNLQLVGDSASPGDSYFYGTNGSGTKGWYALSTLPQGTVTSITSSTLTVAGTSAVPTIDLSSGQVTNIGKGGTALQPGNVADSITTSGGNLQLVGDSASPGDSYFYGTNGSGTKGWYALSTLPQGTVTSITSSTLTVAGSSAVPTIDLSSTQVTNIGLGGTALQPADVADSITTSGGNLQLVGDSASPGDSYFYGTNGSGTKGWYAQATSIATATNLAGGLAGSVPYQTGAGVTSMLAIGTAAQVLTVNAGATAPQWSAQSSLAVGTSTNIAGGLAGSLPYNTAAGATSMLAIGSAGYYLTVNAGATAPQWSALPAYPAGANPSASVGLTAANGSAGTFMRSDGAPALSVAIAPTWTGNHIFSPASGTTTFNGADSTYAAVVVASTTSGKSYGLVVEGGTTSADTAVRITNSGATANFLYIIGDGSIQMGAAAGTSGITLDTSGNLTALNNTTLTTGVTLGTAAAKTVGFYGKTPVAQRATTSAHSTTNVVSSSAYNSTANQKMVAVLQEVVNTLFAYGLYGDH